MAERLKRLLAMRETWVRSLDQEDPLEKEMATHSRFLPGKSHGRRSLVGYSPRGRKEPDATKQSHERPEGLTLRTVHCICLSVI